MSSVAAPRTLVRFAQRPTASARLLCVPYAGGGASAFRQWASAVPADVDVMVAQLPGRESRISQRPVATIDAMVQDILPAVATHTDLPLAIFGHSMGAIVAFELVHAMRATGLPCPVRLFVSASRPPKARDDGLPPMHGLSDDELVTELDRRYGGVPKAVREHRDLMELLLPMLRADITALETYARPDRELLSCPITALAGTRDPRALPVTMTRWAEETTGPFAERTFDGDHFFINPHREAIFAEILGVLANAGVRVGAA